MNSGAYTPSPSSALSPQLLANGFAAHVGAWAQQAQAPAVALVRQAAYLVSMAVSEGHVCTHLDALAQAVGEVDHSRLRQQLLQSTMVGTAAAPGALPLILDAQDRLYLHRYFDYERRLAQRLKPCLTAADSAVAAHLQTRLS